LPEAYSLARAGRWYLQSGIQQPSGGVSRYYRAENNFYKAVSTEITGYAASTMMFFFAATGEDVYLDRARQMARFLCECSWNPALQVFPFEFPSPNLAGEHWSFFFDTGIIVRGLLQVWKTTREFDALDKAIAAARGMAAFRAPDGDYYPILELPSKEALPRGSHWSRSSDCYQLKSMLAWHDVARIEGNEDLEEPWQRGVQRALETYAAFPEGAQERLGIMDRLHAFGYFLEALLPMLDRAECATAFANGMGMMARLLREIEPEFARSDVFAQLLRVRILGGATVPVDEAAAAWEAEELAKFQAVSRDRRVDGGFWFGRRGGEFLPHANPVSTAFAVQALELWREWRAGEKTLCQIPVI
jgi:hypothetical protein